MDDKNEKLSEAPELQDADLTEAAGGSPWSKVGTKIHKGCGGEIEDMGYTFGLASYRYICHKCGEETATLDEFDYYLWGLQSPLG